jgi:hypothetical protein
MNFPIWLKTCIVSLHLPIGRKQKSAPASGADSLKNHDEITGSILVSRSIFEWQIGQTVLFSAEKASLIQQEHFSFVHDQTIVSSSGTGS